MSKNKKILCLCGGVGGAKLALGFSKILTPEQLTIVVNTGDDFEHLGYFISPDIDTVIYTLAGISNKTQGWGLEGETWAFMAQQEKNNGETWFKLGDKDLLTHQLRKKLLAQNKTLSAATLELCKHYGVKHSVLPMSDHKVSTIIKTAHSELPFQHYFVREQCKPVVSGFYFKGIESAGPSAGFLQALDASDLSAVVICPSNPFVSIDPILSLPGVKERLQSIKAPVLAISPIIGGQAIKGPTAKIMQELAIPLSSQAIAVHYRDVIDTLIIDNSDAEDVDAVEKSGVHCVSTQTLMKTDKDKENLARFILEKLGSE
jgi:LPPG:FO 2-phospho-L-lactate transferase